MKGLNDAEAYQKLYGKLVFCVPFYTEHYEPLPEEQSQTN
jgi:hypothetical protein